MRSASLYETWWNQQFSNSTFLTRNAGSQHIKSSWTDSGSYSSSAAQSHHQSAILSGPIQSQMEAFVKYSSALPRLGTTGSVDLLLGADIFNRTMLHGRQFDPSGSPSAFRTCFSWVLVSATHTSSHSNWLNLQTLSFVCIIVLVSKAVWLWTALHSGL